MDHHQAHLTEFTAETMASTLITSGRPDEKEFSKGEHHQHNKEQHQQSDYYKKLTDVIQHYSEVILFGPTTAKNELVNKIHNTPQMADIKVTVVNADKMTENQEHAFVRNHFGSH